MAAADGRNSPIDWDAERRLAELGYTFEDTDEGNEFLNLISSSELNMEVQDHQSRQNGNRSEIFQDYEPQVDGVSKSFGALTTKAKVQEATPKPVKEKRRMMAPYLPGTSRTPAYNLQTNDKKEVVLNRQPKPFAHRNRKDKGAEDYHGGSNNQSEEDSDEERNVTPAVYKWEDTEVYRKAMERKTEEEERKRKARAASAAYGSNPDERPLRFRDGVVRATTWKTSVCLAIYRLYAFIEADLVLVIVIFFLCAQPVPLQTDYTCRDAGVTKGRGLPKKLKSVSFVNCCIAP